MPPHLCNCTFSLVDSKLIGSSHTNIDVTIWANDDEMKMGTSSSLQFFQNPTHACTILGIILRWKK
jgi:hypothetical protein